MALTTFFSGWACINHYHSVDAHGDMHSWGEDIMVGFNKNFNYELIASKLPNAEQKFLESKSPFDLSDYAVLLMKGGKFEESLLIFQALNKHLPNEYKLAANLGTAYELNGELDSALKYINRGMELNANAHDGSEWVHIKVLETKQKLTTHPDYLAEHAVLGLTEAEKKDSAVRVQLEIQIRERFPFSPGPDPIMASLVFDLAECYSNTMSIEHAKALYQIAEQYYGYNPELTQPKIDEMIRLRAEYKHVQPVDDHVEGMVIKMSGVRYKELLDDNNKSGYAINWGDFNTDTEALLSQVDYGVEFELAEETSEVHQTAEDAAEVEETRPVKKDQDNFSTVLWVGIVVIGLGLIFFLVERRKRQI